MYNYLEIADLISVNNEESHRECLTNEFEISALSFTVNKL